MKVLLIGYGNMGREIEAVLLRRGHSIAGRIDPAREDADANNAATN